VSAPDWLWFALGSLTLWWAYHAARSTLLAPLDGELRVTPRGKFGDGRHGPPGHRHQGLDLVAPTGASVLAVGDGVIVDARPGLGGVVRKLLLDVPGAWTWDGHKVVAVVYADLGETVVQPGDRVRRGDVIARVGASGFVHFAVKAAGEHGEQFIDPSEAGFPSRSGGKVQS
jgi:murein DD-endopeptidase MepM/ murein hydrolase activator NlpD